MVQSPPLPKALQKSFYQSQKTSQTQTQTQTQSQSNEPPRQVVLQQKYESGTITLQEFQELFPSLLTKTKYGGTNQTKAVQEYIAYRSSRGLSTSEAEKSLPEYIVKGSSIVAGQKKVSKPSNQIYEGGYSSISGGESSRQGAGVYTTVQPNVGGYSKISGGSGLASYTKETGALTNLVGSSQYGGFIQNIEMKPQSSGQQNVSRNQDYYFNSGVNRVNNDFLDSVRSFVPEKTKQSFQKQREGLYKINSMTNEFVNDIGQGVGSTFYEVDYASKKNSFFNQDFYRSNFVTRDLKPKSEVGRAKTQAIFSDVALKAQYFVPVYGGLKIGSDIVEQTNKNNFDFVPAIAYGGLAYFGLKAIGKGLTKVENLSTNKPSEFLSPEAKASLDDIYENILSRQKPIKQPPVETGFVSKNAQKQLLTLERQGSFSQTGFVSPQANKQLTRIEFFLQKQKPTENPVKQTGFASPNVLSYLGKLELSGTLTAPNKFVSAKAESQFDSIYKNLAKQKDIPKKEDVDLFKEIPPQKFDDKAFIRKTAEVGTGVLLASPVVSSTLSKSNYITSDFDIEGQKRLAYNESTKEARFLGASKLGYELTEFGALRASRYFYEAKAILSGKKGLPEEQLISPQVKAGETNYPKATMNAKSFKRFFEQSSETPLAKKYFEPYAQGFNVSKGKLPKEYLPQEGTSEFSGQYFAPRYPSTTFGIPKGNQGSLEGYSLSPKFDVLEGPPVANLLYGKGVRLVDVRGKGKDVLNKLEPGYFYVPTKGRLRSKSESEAIQNISTLVKRSNNRYYFIEKTLAKQRGFGGGVFFEVPEYKVAGLGQKKTVAKSSPKTDDGVDLRKLFAEAELKSEPYYGNSRRQPVSIYYSETSKQKQSSSYNGSSSRVYSQSRVYLPSYEKISSRYSPQKYSSSSRISYSGSSKYNSVSYPPSTPSYPSSSSSSYSESYSSPPSRPKSSGSYSPPYYPPSPPSRPKSYPKSNKSIESYVKDIRPGFLAVLYKGGKPIRTISNRPLIKQEAIGLGAKFVNNITKRSFKLVRAGVATPTGFRGPTNILRTGKRDKNLYVEKSAFAINTGGEKRELKQARKNKTFNINLRKNFWRGL